MFGLQSVRSFFIACTAYNESLHSDMLLRLLSFKNFPCWVIVCRFNLGCILKLLL